MNYELAKKLTEAGWNTNTTWLMNPEYKTLQLWGGAAKLPYRYYYAPTLEELIEACPKEREGAEFSLHAYAVEWSAGYYLNDDWTLFEDGATPKEAVARLWLALNKQNV